MHILPSSALFVTLLALLSLFTSAKEYRETSKTPKDVAKAKSPENSITSKLSNRYTRLLMESKSKCVIIALRQWFGLPKVVVVKGQQTYQVSQFGRCLKKQECYGFPDPQETNWPFSFERRYVFVIPTNVDAAYIDGAPVELSDGVIVFKKGRVSQRLYESNKIKRTHTISVVLASPSVPDDRVRLHWVTSQSASFETIEMVPLETSNGNYYFGAELVIPPEAKLTRLYVKDHRLVFDHHKPLLRNNEGVFLDSLEQILQYTNGETELAQIFDFSPIDGNQFYLSKVIYRTKLDPPLSVTYKDHAEEKIQFFRLLPDLDAPTNSTNASEYIAHVYLEDPIHKPLNVTIAEANKQFSILLPPSSGEYVVDVTDQAEA